MISDDAIGTPIRSVCIKAVLTSLKDDKFIVQTSDTGQSTYGALQIPNTIIGIGRSNNFVEMFTVAIYEHGTRSMREWSPIIPKSVLYIVTDTMKDTAYWQLTLLVNPTHKVNMILMVDAVLLSILSLIIIVLYFREKVDDEKEQGDAFKYF